MLLGEIEVSQGCPLYHVPMVPIFLKAPSIIISLDTETPIVHNHRSFVEVLDGSLSSKLHTSPFSLFPLYFNQAFN